MATPAGLMLERNARLTLALMPLVMGVVGVGLGSAQSASAGAGAV